jgi:hypothetical protein
MTTRREAISLVYTQPLSVSRAAEKHQAARRIQQLVLAHRPQRSVLDQWETEPGWRPYPVLWLSGRRSGQP